MLRSIIGRPDHRDDDHDQHDDHGGLHRDLLSTNAAMDRRSALRAAAKLGALSLIACAADAGSALTGDTGTSSSSGTACATRVPQETAGPYPGDGSNGANVLNQTGVVRQDIRSSFAGLSGTAAGVPLALELTLVSASTCAPLADYAVYVWHCDRAGNYSLYTSAALNQNYLRGVQAADANGKVTFTSIFPGCYSGRWPHIHFEVYSNLAAATKVSNKIATSQIALPKATCDLVYATTGYDASVRNLASISLASDNVFSDGASLELATCSGNVAAGITAALTVGI
ncbi:MAG TPA: intradiol ring-cleavage dioxygenase [Gemmatimonadaceae bacterium]|nr:intradiol ring-cleavage dioxygenase [Gemmatimonadaceae bacterium]